MSCFVQVAFHPKEPIVITASSDSILYLGELGK